MEKTKLGLPVNVVAAMAYLLFFFGGYTVGLLFLGYVVLCEENGWLRKNVVTALVVLLGFSVLNTVVGLIPDLINLVSSLLHIFSVYFYPEIPEAIFSFFSNIVYFVRLAVFALLAVLAFKKKSVEIKVLGKLFD